MPWLSGFRPLGEGHFQRRQFLTNWFCQRRRERQREGLRRLHKGKTFAICWIKKDFVPSTKRASLFMEEYRVAICLLPLFIWGLSGTRLTNVKAATKSGRVSQSFSPPARTEGSLWVRPESLGFKALLDVSFDHSSVTADANSGVA